MKKNEAIYSTMRSDKQLPKALVAVKPDEIRSVGSLLSNIEAKLTPRQLKAIKEIGNAIGNVGLSLDDALLRSLVSREELDKLILYVPELKDYLRLQQVEYKYKLLNIISSQAVEKADVKMASWLLEKQFSEEYDSSVKKELQKHNRDTEGDMIEMAMTFVRRSNANATPVNHDAGNAKEHEVVKIYDIENIVKQ